MIDACLNQPLCEIRIVQSLDQLLKLFLTHLIVRPSFFLLYSGCFCHLPTQRKRRWSPFLTLGANCIICRRQRVARHYWRTQRFLSQERRLLPAWRHSGQTNDGLTCHGQRSFDLVATLKVGQRRRRLGQFQFWSQPVFPNFIDFINASGFLFQKDVVGELWRGRRGR